MSGTHELMRLFHELQIVRTRDVYAAGIPTMCLTRLVRDGRIRRVCHATYVPAGQELRLETVLREIAVRMPHAIASLGAAAAVHGLEQPDTSFMSVTLPVGCKPVTRSAVPIEAFWERPGAYGLQAIERSVGAGIGAEIDVGMRAGIGTRIGAGMGARVGPSLGSTGRSTDGSTVVRSYGPEKTVTDFFKYRSRVGIARAVAVLDAYLVSDHRDLDALAWIAEANRMTRVMEPYRVACDVLRAAMPGQGHRTVGERGPPRPPPGWSGRAYDA